MMEGLSFGSDGRSRLGTGRHNKESKAGWVCVCVVLCVVWVVE